jgi:beta-N-acetylhexosaminidase
LTPFRLLPLVPALFVGWLSLSAPVAAQSLEEMAGQMIIVGFTGDSVDAKGVKAARAEIAEGLLGGVMYLKTNVKSLKAVQAMNAAFQSASPGLPPFLTLDQEGGLVERLTKAVGFPETPSAADVAAKGIENARATYNKMAAGIADVGFTVNFGPVVDLNRNKNNQIIAKFGRAYGSGANTVTIFAEQFIAAHHQAGLVTSLKHFPGHGSSTADSHEGFVDISNTWDPVELEPYRALFAQGYQDFVMVGHLYHKDYAGSGKVKLPASLSPEWITGVLREQLGFNGVVISDDLEMGAIREHFDLEETVVRAVGAGMDVLLFSNTAKARPTLAAEIRAILVAQAEADPAFKARIEQSYARIVAMKQRIGN